jgi:hypothetical protein
LTCQDGGFGSQILVKKLLVGIMQKGSRADDFIEDHKWDRHQRARPEFCCRGVVGGIKPVDEHSAAPADGLHGYSALMLLEAETAEALSHLAIRFLANQLIFRLTTPKINAADLKKLPRGMAEQMDQ